MEFEYTFIFEVPLILNDSFEKVFNKVCDDLKGAINEV